ncbi:MAG: pyridoxal-phosphate dependent enzyme [Planctomycetes bacterium]|nr:pyridoxal-phosphate dependent enzyme [Planctomycetota bacterium]
MAALRCVRCGAAYAEGEVPYTCPPCGLEGVLDVEYRPGPLEGLAARLRADPERSIWRYLDVLPVRGTAGRPGLHVGWTPVYDFPVLARRMGLGGLRVKDEGRQPTASFKDRASAVGVTKALDLGYRQIACASTGNAASSLAGMAANTGLEATIFVPATAPEAKVAQLRAFGARVLLVEAPYEAAWALCQEAVEAFGWYNRNAAVNPYLVEGKKTCGLEIAEQCSSDPPDWVAVSVGDGCTVAGVGKGMEEMRRLGVWTGAPRLLAVQAAGAAPLAAAAARGLEDCEPWPEPRTAADSINCGEPRNGRKALRAVRASGGRWVTVEDAAIFDAARDLAAATGVFAEPAAAAAYAGVVCARARGWLTARDRVLVVSTGNGLKDVAGAARAAPPARRVAPRLEAVREALAHPGLAQA